MSEINKKNSVSHLAKLTPRQVRWVRSQFASGKSMRCIAKKLSVSQTAVSFLICGKTYTHVK